MEGVQTSQAEVPFLAASPPELGRRLGEALGLPVLSSEGPRGGERVVVVATAATSRPLLDERHLEALGTRLAGLICWQVRGRDLEDLLGQAHAIGIPAFVGLPTSADLQAGVAASSPLPHALDDLALAAYLAAVELSPSGARSV